MLGCNIVAHCTKLGLGVHCTTVSNPGRGETGPAKTSPTLRDQAVVSNAIFTAGTKVFVEGVLKP